MVGNLTRSVFPYLKVFKYGKWIYCSVQSVSIKAHILILLHILTLFCIRLNQFHYINIFYLKMILWIVTRSMTCFVQMVFLVSKSQLANQSLSLDTEMQKGVSEQLTIFS